MLAKIKILIIILLPLFTNQALFADEFDSIYPDFILSLNLGRFLPLNNKDFTNEIGGEYFDSTLDFKDDMSFGGNLKFVIKKRFFIEAGGDFSYVKGYLSGDILDDDLAGGYESKLQFEKTTLFMNLGILPFSWGRLFPYLSIGPTWSLVTSKKGNIDADFYPRNADIDKITKVNLIVKAAKLKKKIEENDISGTSDNAFGYNLTVGMNFFIDNNSFIDIGIRYTHDKVKLWESETFKTGGFNIFIGAGFSLNFD